MHRVSLRRFVVVAMKIAACAVMATCALAPSAGRADATASARPITFVVGYSVNTGYDVYSRLVARYIGKYLPGRPDVVVQNMPGAGSLEAINYLYNIAPHDGSVLGMIDQAAALTQLISPRGFHANVDKFNWIGRVASNTPVMLAWHKAAVQTIQQAYDHALIVSAAGQNSRMLTTLLKNMLDLKLKIVTGYASSADSVLAMQRGEVDAMTMPWSVFRSLHPDWITEKKVNLLLQMGAETNSGLSSVPVITSLAKNERQRKILDFMTSDAEIGRSVMSPPDEPSQRVAQLRAAFMQAMRDPGLLADVRRARLDLDPLSGDKLQHIVQRAADVAPDLVSEARKLADVAH